MVPERLDRQTFFGSNIDYPPPGEQNRPCIIDPDIKTGLTLSRPIKGEGDTVTKKQFLKMLGRIKDYVKVLNGKTDI